MTLTDDEMQFLNEIAETEESFEIWVTHMEEDFSLLQVR